MMMIELDTTHPIGKEMAEELKANKIMIYSKGTKTQPKCGFAMRTAQIFQQVGLPFEMQDVLENPEKRMYLNEVLEWPTLPKIFIDGEFQGGFDILVEMVQNGELEAELKKAFPDTAFSIPA